MYKIDSKIRRQTLQFIVSTIVIIFIAIVINIFTWQNKIFGGGFAGLALVLEEITNVNAGTLLWIMNIGILVLAFIIAGKLIGVKALYGFTLLSFSITFTRPLLGITQLEEAPGFVESFGIMVLFGLLIGNLLAIILILDYSAGAGSTLYFVVNKFINISPQALFIAIDILVAISATLLFDIERGILVFVASYASYWAIKLSTPIYVKFFP